MEAEILVMANRMMQKHGGLSIDIAPGTAKLLVQAAILRIA